MENLTPTLKDKGFLNWLKGALAIVFAKQGLHDFVSVGLTQFQKDILTSICSKNHLSPGTSCSTCTTQNVLRCPTRNYCPRGRNCNFHDNSLSDKTPNKPCPYQICQGIYDEILQEHRFDKPSWKNTDATGWCTNPFEIAKCYLPPDGYSSIKTFASADFNGIISVIINNKRFVSKMNDDLDNEPNICTKARDCGKCVRHNADMSISDVKLVEIIGTLNDLLSDKKYLATDSKAQEAFNKLKQLTANTLTITTQDITAILDDEFKEIVSRQQSKALQTISTEREEAQTKLLNDVKESLVNMKTVTLNDLDQIVKTKKSEIKELAEKEKKELTKISAKKKDEIKELAEIEKATLLEFSAKGKQEIKADNLKGKGQTHTAKEIEKKKIECLQDDLVNLYRKDYSTIPVSPLIKEHDVALVDFYVPPPLYSIDIQKKFGRIREVRFKTKVDSLKDVFLKPDDNIYNDIYIAAKAGIGKTSFVKRICMLWCQALKPIAENETKFTQNELRVMKSFCFLFMISLRDIYSSVCSVDEMIFGQIIKKLARSRRYDEIFMEDILQEYPCLIILDGLDEWTHPESYIVGLKNEHRLPHRPAREKCTIMTTTRQWKLNALMLGSNQIDRHVEIEELDKASSEQLISNAVALLKRRSSYGELKTVAGFQKTVSSAMLDSLRFIPYILLQMVCLWFDDESIGESKCEIYSNILELTLRRSRLKLEDQHWISSDGDSFDDQSFPKCLHSNELCKEQYDLILKLGQIAFESLFCLKKESTVVFDAKMVLDTISDDHLQFCLKLGILAQSKDCQKVTSRRRSFSFQHKSIQEYLAALYMHSDINNSAILEQLIRTCSNLSTVLEMSNMLIFLGGFSASACGKVLQLLKEKVSNDETIVLFRENLLIKEYGLTEFWKIREAIRGLQDMLTDILQESKATGQNDCPLMIEDVIIDSTTDAAIYHLLGILIEQNKENIKSLYVQDVEYSNDFTTILEATGLLKLQGLEKLVLIAVPQTKELEDLLSNSSTTMKCLRLSFVEFRNNLYFPKVTSLPTNIVETLSNTEHLLALMLSNISLTHANVKVLFDALNRRANMTEIGLYNVDCEEHNAECPGEPLDLSKHQCLKTLNLDKIPVSDLLVNPSALNECLIGEDTTSVFPTWFDCLNNATILHSLWFRRMTPALQDKLSVTLPKLRQLRKFGIELTDLGERSLTLLPGIHIDSVYFYRVNMTAAALKLFAESAAALSHSVNVTLERSDVTPVEDFHQIKDEIKTSSKYHVKVDGLNFRQWEQFEFETIDDAQDKSDDQKVLSQLLYSRK